jgi:hypothetical protein
VTVFAFSQGRFSEKQIDIENIDPPLPARYFTSRFRYISSALVFAGAYVILYICLIIVGSLPAFQDVLKPLFGSLAGAPRGDAPSAQNADIGTPAWAAMLIMVVAPTVPRIRRIEQSFRFWLQEFSDTPFKARELADEIIQSLLASLGPPLRLEDALEPELVAVFDRLEELRQKLTASGRSKRDQNYREFFSEQGEILSQTLNQFRIIQGELVALRKGGRRARPSIQSDAQVPSLSAPPSHRTQMVTLVRRLGRLIACALLYAESEEFAVRERLREMPHLSDFARASFQFTIVQVLLAMFMIALVAIVAGPVISVIINLSSGVVTPDQLLEQIKEWSARGVVLAVAFVLPMFLVAAVRLYLIDLTVHGRGEMSWQENMMMLLLTFIGCYGLSVLPQMAFQAYEGGQQFSSTNLALASLHALPPAIANSAFVKISEFHWRGTTTRNAVFDFAIFAGLGGASAVIAAALLSLMYLQGAGNFEGFIPFFQLEIPFAFTVALVSGLNGALQCGASRVIINTEANALRLKTRVDAPVPSGTAGQPTA